MATDSFTSAANIVSSATAFLSVPGDMVLSTRGFKVRINSSGVYVTKAPTLGGTQAALAFPLSKNDARELALLLLQMAN
jgi:hypothetical protein